MGPVEQGLVLSYDDVRRRLHGRPSPPLQPSPLTREIEALRQTVELLEEQVRQFQRQRDEDNIKTTEPRIRDILRAVGKFYGVSIMDMLSPRRHPDYCRARHVAFWLARTLTRLSYPQIGMHMDRDHSTVVHGFDKIEALRGRDAGLDGQLNVLKTALSPCQV